MAGNREKLVLVGGGETAAIAYDYFIGDTNFEVAGFSVERGYIRDSTLFGLPVVPLEEIQNHFDPQTHKAFVAVSYTQLNRLRRRLLDIVKAKGYRLCSYISPNAYIGTDTEIGDNCFILEGVIIQRGAKIGDNVTLWSGSIVGHRSILGANCFVATQVAISGFCTIGNNCFFGVNSCLRQSLKVARDSVIGAGAVVVADTLEGRVYVGNPARLLPNKTAEAFISGKETL